MRITSAFTFVVTLGLSASGSAHAAEHRVPCSTLPAAVQAKSHDVAAGATIHSCVKETAGSKTTYEVEMTLDGRGKDVTFSAIGDVLEVEQQVDPAALPQPVAAAFQKASGGAPLGKVESVTHRGVVVSYEGTVNRGGKHVELAFAPDGTAMKAD